MIKREDYIRGKVSHEDYFSQFVTPIVKDLVVNQFGLVNIMASPDNEFANISNDKWVRASLKLQFNITDAMNQAGDSMNAITGVHVLKEAAKQVKRDFT